MGLLSGLLGNASEIDGDRLDHLLESVLVPGEQVAKAYKLVRDLFVFTTRRLIVVDKQGVTGKKVALLTIPYARITKFAKESAGHFDLDAELKVWVGSDPEPVCIDFGRNGSADEAYRFLSEHVLA